MFLLVIDEVVDLVVDSSTLGVANVVDGVILVSTLNLLVVVESNTVGILILDLDGMISNDSFEVDGIASVLVDALEMLGTTFVVGILVLGVVVGIDLDVEVLLLDEILGVDDCDGSTPVVLDDLLNLDIISSYDFFMDNTASHPVYSVVVDGVTLDEVALVDDELVTLGLLLGVLVDVELLVEGVVFDVDDVIN